MTIKTMILDSLKEGPTTIPELTARRGGGGTTIRRCLQDLVELGVAVRISPVPSTVTGRPPYLWRLA